MPRRSAETALGEWASERGTFRIRRRHVAGREIEATLWFFLEPVSGRHNRESGNILSFWDLYPAIRLVSGTYPALEALLDLFASPHPC